MKHTIQRRIYRGERQYIAECLDLPTLTSGVRQTLTIVNHGEVRGTQVTRLTH